MLGGQGAVACGRWVWWRFGARGVRLSNAKVGATVRCEDRASAARARGVDSTRDRLDARWTAMSSKGKRSFRELRA